MNYREVEILAPEDLGTTGTKVIDINVIDPISSIELIWQTTVVTAALMTAPHVACISKIEIIDGSDVLTSLSGEEAQALAFYHTRKMPLNQISVKATEYMRSVIPIYFGRKLFDKQLALDPKRYKNPQIRVTWDEDAANANVVANELTIRGWCFDQKSISPQGFLMAKEIKSYTPVANGFQYTDLPLDYPIRMLMLQSKSTDKEPGEVLAQVKLSEDNDKRIPIDMTGQEIFRKFASWYPQIHEQFDGADAVTASDLYGAPTAFVKGLAEVDADIIAAGDDFSQVTVAGNKLSVSLAVNCLYYGFHAFGYCPHFCLPIPFGDQDDLDDWYDVAKVGGLRLIQQGAAAVGTTPTGQIVLQQFRK